MSEPSEDPPPRAERTFDSSDDSEGDSREGNDVGDLNRASDACQTKARRVRKAILLTIVIILALIVLIPCAFVGFVILICNGGFH